MPTKRPTFAQVSDEMKRHAALLEAELKRWPGVRTSRMFGMISVYRKDVIFALLPATRSLWSPNSIMVKPQRPAKREGEKWQSGDLNSEADLGRVLERLDEAYRKAAV